MCISQWHTNTYWTRDPKFATAIRTRYRHWNYLDLTKGYGEGTNRTSHTCAISRFHHHVFEIYALLGCCTTYAGSSMFWDSILVPSSKVKMSKNASWPLKVGTIQCPETSITNLRRAATQKSVSYNLQMCHYSRKISTIYYLTEMSKRRLYVADSGFSKIKKGIKRNSYIQLTQYTAKPWAQFCSLAIKVT